MSTTISTSGPLGAGAASFLMTNTNFNAAASPVNESKSSSQIGSSGLELGQSALTSQGTKIEKAASEFEALLIGQILKSSQDSNEGGWMGADSGDADSSVIELAEQQLASALSQQGGLGLGKLIEKGLKQSENSVQVQPTTDQ